MPSTDEISGVLPDAAIVICTRHRPPSTAGAVRSALACRPAAAVVFVVDQADAGTADPLAEFDGMPRYVRIPCADRGLSRGRNVGMAAAAAAGARFVAFTDDDCVADPTWLRAFDEAFASAADVAAVFGSVLPAPYDRTTGIIPAYEAPSAMVLRGLGDKPRAEGMGACMGVRVDAWQRLDGFDEWLGPGALLTAADDSDLVMRLLFMGFAVAETSAVKVVHYGFRDWPAARRLVAGYVRGYGAVHAKMVRLAGSGALAPLKTVGRRWLFGRPAIDLNHVPSRWLRLREFVKGAATGFSLRVDPVSGRFRQTLPAAPPTNSAATREEAA
jgi:glycosyltransferase involved in cell wall biosynthesis